MNERQRSLKREVVTVDQAGPAPRELDHAHSDQATPPHN